MPCFFPISSPNSVPFGSPGNRLTFTVISSLPPSTHSQELIVLISFQERSL